MRTVLLVAPTTAGVEHLSTLLTRPGLRLLGATTGLQALDIHRAQPVQLMVMDLNMPGMNGEDVALQIRADPALRAVSIITFSDGTDPNDRKRALEAGANEHVERPFDPANLLGRVMRFVDIAVRRDLRVLMRGEAQVEGNGQVFMGHTVNLSASGLLLQADVPLQVGAEVDVTFVVPATRIRVTATCKVARRAQAHDGTRRWGVQFLHLGPEAKEAVIEYVAGRPGV